MSHGAKADDIITRTLLDHVATVTQFQSGDTKLALVDSVVLIGSRNGKSVFDLQGGFQQDTASQKEGWIGGGFLKFSTLIQDVVNYPDHWEFLNSIEHGPALFYDFTEKTWRGNYQVGLAFGLNPK